jgi:iron complex outermembrane recepter protein
MPIARTAASERFAYSLATLVLAFAATSAEAQSASEHSGVEEIIVTANKRDINQQDVAMAASAIGHERLAELGAVRLTDLTSVVPGFNFSRTSNVNTVFIRGVGGGGRNIGFAGRTGIYLDGVYVGQPGAIDQSLVDIERVEILRGPQGTMFGRNAVSGAINVVTRAPSDEVSSGIIANAGNFDRRSLSGWISGPLGDVLTAKLSAHSERRDGFVRNLFDGSDEIGQIDVDSVRAAMRIEPNDRLRLDISADYTKDASLRSTLEANSSTLGTGTFDPFAPQPFVLNENDVRTREDSNYGVNATIQYALDKHSLTSISAFRKVESTRHSDNDYGPLSLLFTDFDDEFEQWSQELRLTSADNQQFRYVVGVFGLREEATTFRTATAGADVVGRFPVAPKAVSANAADITTQSYALFAHGDLDLGDAFTISAGMRYTFEERELLFDLDGSRSGAFNIGTLRNFRDSDDESRFTPELSVSYRAADDVLMYATYAEGFKSGGWNVDFLSRDQLTPAPGTNGTPFAFDAERVRSHEVGVKSEWFDHRLRANVAAFLADYRDFQTNQFVAVAGGRTVLFLTNAAEVSTRGVELSIEARPFSALRMNVDAAYIDAKFDRFPRGGIAGSDATGNDLPYSPDFCGAFRASYELPFGFAGGRFGVLGQYSYRSSSSSGQENSRDQEMGSYDLVSARVGWTRDDSAFGIALWGENLTDELYVTNRVRDFIGTQAISFGEPRTYGVEVRASF